MAKVVVDPAAAQELDEIWAFIAKDNPVAADRVFLAALDAFERLAENPRMAARQRFSEEEFKDVRNWPVPGFEQYMIFYLPLVDGVQIIHVCRDAREINALFQHD
jgi:toxin ParE1/3/4